MSARLYTQCPQCHTIFAVTDEQLGARQGLVRCGKCATVFRGDEYRFDTLPRPVSTGAQMPAFAQSALPDDADIPIITDLLPRPRKHRPLLWAFFSVLALLALIGQYAYIERSYLAQDSHWRPLLAYACAKFNCRIPLPQNLGAIELSEVRVTPHPEFDKALRVEARLFNHSEWVQAYPALEVGLTDTSGAVIARRVFRAAQYLSSVEQAELGMPRGIAVPARLELNLPADNAVGYEVQLVRDPRV